MSFVSTILWANLKKYVDSPREVYVMPLTKDWLIRAGLASFKDEMHMTSSHIKMGEESEVFYKA